MRCHEVLGIDERATVSDIMLAYVHRWNRHRQEEARGSGD